MLPLLSRNFAASRSLKLALPYLHRQPRSLSICSRTMTDTASFKQEPHKLLAIPGPIEVEDEVLYANAHYSVSHVGSEFIPVFGECIQMIRDVVFTQAAQPFIIAGSGTLGWDQVSSNLVEPGEKALVLNSGYFGDGFADCLETYGAHVTQLKAPLGAVVMIDDLKTALQSDKYKLVTVTHVDTSTGVLSDIKAVAHVVRELSPETLVVVDGVCSVASEEIKFDEWGLDIILTASQKGLGTPPGLSVLLASQRAMRVFEQRKTPITSYYASWKRWLPIMKAYEAGNPTYFATPPTNLIFAFHASLKRITQSAISVEERIQRHKEASQRVKDAASSLGLRQVATDPTFAANGMTALYYPEGVTAPLVIPDLLRQGIVVAAGLHKDIKNRYFRIGHMGVSVVDTSRNDIERIVSGLNSTISEAKRVAGADKP